jgi:hypothetical protein
VDGRRLTAIYLQDHVAVLAGGEDLVRRTLGETQLPELRRLLADILPELRDDRAALVRLLGGLGRGPSAVKAQLARLAERAGRLKLNGKPTGYSPLSRVVELEGIAVVLAATRSTWRALEHAGPADGREDAARRARRLDERIAQVEELRLLAAEVAFTGGGRRL